MKIKNKHYYNRLIKLDKYLENNRHICGDDTLELTYKIDHNGGEVFVYQCNICGEQRKQALKRIEALSINSKPKIFNKNIQDNFYKKRNRFLDIRKKLIQKTEDKPTKNIDNGFEPYFIKREKEALEIVSDLKNKYSNLGYIDELLINIQTILREEKVNLRVNDQYKLFNNEEELKEWFKKYFIDDFFIYDEVNGVHLSTNENVRIDFILAPRKHLTDNGFIKEFFGVEVKYLNPEKDLDRKATRGIWQTITYNDCKFSIKPKKGDIREFIPRFSMLFSNLSFHDESILLEKYYSNKKLWFAYLHLANHANVGSLNIKGYGNQFYGWIFSFAGGMYFSKTIHDEKVIFKLHNENTIMKKRIGNF